MYGIESDEIERYRLKRTSCGAAEGAVNVKVILLSAMYTEARKAKKIHADMVPGEFRIVDEKILDQLRMMRHLKPFLNKLKRNSLTSWSAGTNRR